MSEDKKYLFGDAFRLLFPDMPQPVTEFRFAKQALGRNWAFDWAWPNYRIAVEVDGGQYVPRGGRHMTDKDREKTNAANDLRWFVYHYSPQQLKRDPAGCVEQVARAIRLERE